MKVKIQKLYRLKTKPWRDMDAHTRGLEAQNEALDGL
jgi:hypothetical protein